jgi:hypothetical protein
MFPTCNEELRLRFPSSPTEELLAMYPEDDPPVNADSPHSRAVAIFGGCRLLVS